MLFLLLAACESRTLGLDPRADGDAVLPDATVLDAAVTVDAGADRCGCPSDRPTYLFGECVPPSQLGCAAPACTPGGDDCAPGYTCQECGAAACCNCAACRPTCIRTGPVMEPVEEDLKIEPTFTPVGRDMTLTIQGHPFYVGALFYLARVGPADQLFQMGGGACSFQVEVPGQAAGTVPVWVSQYGGREPWVLAGFLTWTDGPAPVCTQPGFPCQGDGSCCASPDVPMACTEGRCRRR